VIEKHQVGERPCFLTPSDRCTRTHTAPISIFSPHPTFNPLPVTCWHVWLCITFQPDYYILLYCMCAIAFILRIVLRFQYLEFFWHKHMSVNFY